MTAVLRHTVLRLQLCFALGASSHGSESWVFNGIAPGAGKVLQTSDLYDHDGVSACLSMTEGSAEPERPNVLLVGIETLRADHVGCLGYKIDTTPTLDRLAREGVLCARALSTSGWTLPSVMSVMTSLYPDVHRMHTHESRLAQEIVTLAEVLKADGYTTIGFVSNPVIDGEYGFSDGFDLYDDFTISLDSGLDIFERHNTIAGIQHLAGIDELVTRTAEKWLEQGPNQPFFMFVFYIDPHYDYIPPPPFDAMFDPNYEGDIDGRRVNSEPLHSQRPPDRDLQHLLALYDGEIRYTDSCVAALLEAFARSGVLENTVVIIFGDHGDEFYEHGRTAHDRTLYDEIIHVPLIWWWPGALPAGRRLDAVVSQIDIMPTILDCVGVSYAGPMQGASLRPLIQGRAARLHETVWAELNTAVHVQALVDAHHKLIRNVSNSTWELYDIQSDPHESVNLYDQPSAMDVRIAMTTELSHRIREHRTLADNLLCGATVEKMRLDAQQLLRLKALGYAQ